jgi:hypothetical protein
MLRVPEEHAQAAHRSDREEGSEDGSGTGSDAKKWGCTKFKAAVNTSVLLSVLPRAVNVPLKVASVFPLPKA